MWFVKPIFLKNGFPDTGRYLKLEMDKIREKWQLPPNISRLVAYGLEFHTSHNSATILLISMRNTL